jgi:hypothetical protein
MNREAERWKSNGLDGLSWVVARSWRLGWDEVGVRDVGDPGRCHPSGKVRHSGDARMGQEDGWFGSQGSTWSMEFWLVVGLFGPKVLTTTSTFSCVSESDL